MKWLKYACLNLNNDKHRLVSKCGVGQLEKII